MSNKDDLGKIKQNDSKQTTQKDIIMQNGGSSKSSDCKFGDFSHTWCRELAVFEQSWSYIRHAQDMFWKSFLALFTILSGILLYSFDAHPQSFISPLGSILVFFLSAAGFFFTERSVVVIREHFITINKIRFHCKIDEMSFIPRRWKTYDVNDFMLMRS